MVARAGTARESGVLFVHRARARGVKRSKGPPRTGVLQQRDGLVSLVVRRRAKRAESGCGLDGIYAKHLRGGGDPRKMGSPLIGKILSDRITELTGFLV